MAALTPQNVARLFLALFLFSIWLGRRADRTPLCWAMAYLALAIGSVLVSAAVEGGRPDLVAYAAIFPGIYVGMFWAGTQYFRDRVPNLVVIAAIIVLVAVVVAAVLAISVEKSDLPVGISIAAVTLWSAWVIYRRNPKYWIVAGILVAQALLLLSVYLGISEAESVLNALAAVYGLLAMGLVYVILQESNERIERHATTDQLTGLPNRRRFLGRLDAAMRSAGSKERVSAVFLVDIDRLKRINDAFGYPAGDEVLRQMAQRLVRLDIPNSFVARYGGDEFALYIDELDVADVENQAQALALRIVESMNLRFLVREIETPLMVSIGIAVSGEGVSMGDDLVQRARLAILQNPQFERSSWNFFSHESNARMQRPLTIERLLRRALKDGELTVAYQPIVNAHTREVMKFEALLRWNSDELGWIDPTEFVPIAERVGMIHELGSWVLEQACAEAARWRRDRPLIAVCVNVSGLQLLNTRFPEIVADILLATATPGALLELEFTESVLIADDPVVNANVVELRQLGVGLSLDDFGTGFSSLSNLARFDFSTLKIDRSFVHRMRDDDRSLRLAESICAIGKSLGLKLVAEGVETADEADILLGFGVHYMQGFLFGAAVSPAEALARVRSSARGLSGTRVVKAN